MAASLSSGHPCKLGLCLLLGLWLAVVIVSFLLS